MMGMIRAFTLCALIGLPGLAGAAVVQVQGETELVQKSDAVVMGTVASVTTRVQRGGGVITMAELRIFRSLRGVSPGQTISVVVPGGQLDNGMISYVAGAPTPKVGDWAVLLLESKGELWTPRGLSLGWIQLRGSEASGFIAYRELDGLSLVGDSGVSVASEPYRIRAMPLDKLWTKLESSMTVLESPAAGEVQP